MKIKKAPIIFLAIIALLVFFMFIYMSLPKDGRLNKIGEADWLNPHQLSTLVVYNSNDIKVTSYKPLKIEDSLKYIKRDILENIHPIKTDDIPFETNEGLCFISDIKLPNEKNQKQHVQFTYSGKKDLNRGYQENFLCISVYETNGPKCKEAVELLAKNKDDLFGNEVNTQQILDNCSLIHINRTTNASLVCNYYTYNPEDNKLGIVSTSANELLAYKDGLLYHIGYHLDDNSKEKQIIKLVKNFITG